jgi:hypothetical protein
MGQMDSDLMGPTGFWKNFQDCISRESLRHFELSLGLTAARMLVANRHFLALVRMVSDGLDDSISIAVQ